MFLGPEIIGLRYKGRPESCRACCCHGVCHDGEGNVFLLFKMAASFISTLIPSSLTFRFAFAPIAPPGWFL